MSTGFFTSQGRRKTLHLSAPVAVLCAAAAVAQGQDTGLSDDEDEGPACVIEPDSEE